MNHIKSLRIIGFKKIKDTKIIFNENLNIIIGENESGKSTILEAIDIVINQLYKNSDKSIIGDLINKENIEKFRENPSIENLPKICIELELDLPTESIKNINYSGLEYTDSDLNNKTGIVFTCEIDKESENEIISFINEGKIPYEYYLMQWKTFSGSSYKSIQKPIKYLGINTSNIEANNSFNYFNKSLFNNKYSGEKKMNIKTQYFSQVEGLFDRINGMERIDNKRKFEINTKKVILENIITIVDEGIPIENKGKGMENLIKTEIALEKNSNNDIISIEEPESHLSHTNLRKMIKLIEEKEKKAQIIITTHNSLIVSNLDLRNVIFLNDTKPVLLNDLEEKVSNYFIKSDNTKLMEFLLSKKTILVEGNTEYMLIPNFYKRIYNRDIELDDIFVISAAGLSYKNYIENEKKLNKKLVVLTDNDKNQKKIDEINIFNEQNDKIKIFTDTDIRRWTFEVCLYNDNTEKLDRIIEIEPNADYFFHGENYGKKLGKMLNNKTETAFELLKIEELIIPTYIREAMKWIKE